MIRRRSEICVSDLKLDRWLAGELSADAQQNIEAHLQACDGCRSRHAGLVESRREFVRDAEPLQALVERVSSRSPRAPSPTPSPARGRRQRFRGLAVGSAAAASIAIAITQPWNGLFPSARDVVASGTRAKGGRATLGWVVRRGERVFAGHPDQRLRPGDALRFTVSSREPVYVAVFGIDASGRLSVFHSDGEGMAKVEAGREQPLPMAIELDATPGKDVVYGVFCANAMPLSQVKQAIESAPAAPAPPEGCSIDRRSVSKEEP